MSPLARRILRWLIAGCLALTTLEVAARVDDWLRHGADPLAYYGPKNLLALSDEGETHNRPLARFEKWRHDERGYRVSTPPGTTPPVARWTCLGSSETYGLYERPGGEWPAALGALVAPAGVRVDNASVVGISPFELKWYLDRHVLPYEPDLVIVVISPFIFTLGLASGVEPDSAQFADPARIARMRVSRAPTLREQSRFLAKAQRSVIRRLPPDWTRRLAIASKERKLERLRRAGKRPDTLLDVPPPPTVATYVEVLGRLQRQLAARGVDLAVCTYPNSLRLDGTLAVRDAILDRTLWLPQYSAEGLCAIAAQFAAATRAFCDTSGAVLIDLEAAVPPGTENFADSVHLTDLGAERAAAAAQAALTTRLDAAAPPPG